MLCRLAFATHIATQATRSSAGLPAGATVHYPAGTNATNAGLSSLDPAGTDAEGRKLFTAPNPKGGVDVVECIDVAKAQELGGGAAGS
jgi:hypothetical protein